MLIYIHIRFEVVCFSFSFLPPIVHYCLSLLFQNLYEMIHEVQKHGTDSSEATASNDVDINFEEFLEIYHQLCVRQETIYLLDQYASMGSSYLTAPQLLVFMQCEQQVRAINSFRGRERGGEGLQNFSSLKSCVQPIPAPSLILIIR